MTTTQPQAGSEPLYQAVFDCLMNHSLSHTADIDSGEKYPLVDKLSAPSDKTIKTGKDEVQLLAEAITDAIGSLPDARQAGSEMTDIENMARYGCFGGDGMREIRDGEWIKRDDVLAIIARHASTAPTGYKLDGPVIWVHYDTSGLAFSRDIHVGEKKPDGDRWKALYHVEPDTFAPAPEALGAAQWQPIETALRTGRTLLLGYPNSLGKWRTVRGQWMSDEYIAEYWEDPDDVEPGWFETSVEADDTQNCWRIQPTHWMPLPQPPAIITKEQA